MTLDGRPMLSVVPLVLLSALLFVLIFDRYSYYDYREARCRAGSFEVVANLIGSFGADQKKARTSPYYLRVKFVGQSEVTAAEVLLTASASKRVLDLDEIKRVEVRKEGTHHATVYLANSLQLEYENFVVSGLILNSAEPASQAVFACTLETNYPSEWRMTWWDGLLSV